MSELPAHQVPCVVFQVIAQSVLCKGCLSEQLLFHHDAPQVRIPVLVLAPVVAVCDETLE